MVQNTASSNSLVKAESEACASKQASEIQELPPFELDKKAIWGLYFCYAAIGTVNGFFATYLATPTICQYLFGPLGVNVTEGQCNVAPSIFQMSWNFKLFLGFILDNVGLLGTRRKGWLMFGWTGGLIMLVVNALTVDSYIANHDFSGYLTSLSIMCCFYTFSDVAGDGLIIEMSKYEPDDRRGYLLTTCQMIRFSMMMFVTIFGMIFMSGKEYQSPNATTGSFELPFELPFNVVHWCLFAMALPSYIGMWLFIKEPPATVHHERGFTGFVQAFGRCWQAMKSYAMFMLLVQCVGILGFASMLNPALQDIAMVANPTSFQNALGASLGNFLFVIGVFLFRKYLLTYNWRITLVWTYALIALGSLFCVMMVHNTWGAQSGWFYMIQNALPMFVQGLCQVLTCLAVIEISPAGLEATIYEMMISAMNGAQSLQAALQSQLAGPFKLGAINANDWADNHCARNNGTWGDTAAPICHTWEERMVGASWMTLGVNMVSILLFCWFMPKNAKHCREWAAKKSWHNSWAAALNAVMFAGPFTYAIYTVFQFN